ncbi:CCA tRNA nucleotidyltransferase [Blastopirellula sp. JC732]|uniref:CCA tRNA nucleotidyltransferase n=1 Tax=Blastopirellula sediminis TaxID=2894196 RepID=A0A9X1MML2_9BACT|nr:CCA tRNA nucleotidyltransferase [Blastopirellula sediminis]MCC9609751.1 CCA tRNA nucleotidyltransferase [Blastopirellula sediminis]MCC9628995.1 CCA tRNA nucleotidyltransferase [Blastopirellula sediminis]
MNVPSPDHARDFSLEVVRTLKHHGHQALWAGGCVRDMLLGRTPKDFDVATDAPPERVREIFGEKRTLAIGASFGVITVQGGKRRGQIEVATFREDLGYSDGRRPDQVRFTSAAEDAKRRDFTINGIFYDPDAEVIYDYVGGQVDLRERLVRAIGDPNERFAEDKLRMLRAIRFSSTFQFDLEMNTLLAIQRHARNIAVVSAERIAVEMRKMICSSRRVDAVLLLRDSWLFQVVLPEIIPIIDHAPRWTETLRSLHYLPGHDFATGLAALLRYAAARDLETVDPRKPVPMLVEICLRWKLTNDETKDLQWLLRHVDLLRVAKDLPWPRLQRLLIDPRIEKLVNLATAITVARSESMEHLEFVRERLQWSAERLNPQPVATGDDLIRSGLKPGPHFQGLLEAIRDAQLVGQIGTLDEALEMARNWRPA